MNEQKKIIIRRLYLNKKPSKIGEIIKFQGLNAKSYAQIQSNIFRLHKGGVLKRIWNKGDYYYYLNQRWLRVQMNWLKEIGVI